MTLMNLFSKKKDDDKSPKYKDNIPNLINQRDIIEKNLELVNDPEMFLVYQGRLVSINNEISYFIRKSKEANERNDISCCRWSY